MPKRANGEGSITRHKASGLWLARVSLEGRRLSKYFRRKRDAEAWIDDLLAQLRRRRVVADAGSLTVGDWLRYWLEHLVARRAPKTQVTYARAVERYLLPEIGHLRLWALRAEHIDALYEALQRRGLSPATVHQAHRVLRRALRVADRRGYFLFGNPMDAVEETPPLPRPRRQAWTEAEAGRFLLAASSSFVREDATHLWHLAGRDADGRALAWAHCGRQPKHGWEAGQAERPDGSPGVCGPCLERSGFEAWYLLGLSTALRRGELLGLRWQDVDLDGGTVTVRHTMNVVEGLGLVEGPTKTDESVRRILLPQLALDGLRRHKARQTEARLRAGPMYQDQGLVFASAVGTPLWPTTVHRHFKLLVQRLGLPDIPLYNLRHTCSTMLAEAGVPEKARQEWLGHARASTTADVYTRFTPAMQRQAAAAIDARLGALLERARAAAGER